MKVRVAHLIGALLVATMALLFLGCSEDQSSQDTDPNQANNAPTNFVPTSLAGRSYTFNVTATQGFAEPMNADYTIDFNSESSYTLHPNAQNRAVSHDSQGNYSYDYRNEVIHFAETSPLSGRIVDAALTFTSATTGSAHLTGRNGESQDAVF